MLCIFKQIKKKKTLFHRTCWIHTDLSLVLQTSTCTQNKSRNFAPAPLGQNKSGSGANKKELPSIKKPEIYSHLQKGRKMVQSYMTTVLLIHLSSAIIFPKFKSNFTSFLCYVDCIHCRYSVHFLILPNMLTVTFYSERLLQLWCKGNSLLTDEKMKCVWKM